MTVLGNGQFLYLTSILSSVKSAASCIFGIIRPTPTAPYSSQYSTVAVWGPRDLGPHSVCLGTYPNTLQISRVFLQKKFAAVGSAANYFCIFSFCMAYSSLHHRTVSAQLYAKRDDFSRSSQAFSSFCVVKTNLFVFSIFIWQQQQTRTVTVIVKFELFFKPLHGNVGVVETSPGSVVSKERS